MHAPGHPHSVKEKPNLDIFFKYFIVFVRHSFFKMLAFTIFLYNGAVTVGVKGQVDLNAQPSDQYLQHPNH